MSTTTAFTPAPLLLAMARQEGALVVGSRPYRLNNPGDIEYGKFTRVHGAIGSDGRFAIFQSMADGYACMRALLLSAYAGLTVAEAINKYAPPLENNTNLYLADVCLWANVKPTDLIDSCLATPPPPATTP